MTRQYLKCVHCDKLFFGDDIPSCPYCDGWQDATQAIICRLPGHQLFSTGTSQWDKGWNNRLEYEVDRQTYAVGRTLTRH